MIYARESWKLTKGNTKPVVNYKFLNFIPTLKKEYSDKSCKINYSRNRSYIHNSILNTK